MGAEWAAGAKQQGQSKGQTSHLTCKSFAPHVTLQWRSNDWTLAIGVGQPYIVPVFITREVKSPPNLCLPWFTANTKPVRELPTPGNVATKRHRTICCQYRNLCWSFLWRSREAGILHIYLIAWRQPSQTTTEESRLRMGHNGKQARR